MNVSAGNRRNHFRARYVLAYLVLFLAFVVLAGPPLVADWILPRANAALANLGTYRGSMGHIKIEFLRGVFRVDQFAITKKQGTIATPFLAIDHVETSLDWSALLRRRVAAHITVIHPVLTLSVKGSEKQTGEGGNWSVLKQLMPLDINSITVEDGSLAYQDLGSTPNVALSIHDLNGVIGNLQNVEDKDALLPAHIDLAGTSIGDGHLSVNGRMNVVKQTPDLDVLMALEHLDLPAINSFTQAYASFALKNGTFDLHSQIVVQDGRVGGYIKPVATHLIIDTLRPASATKVIWSKLLSGVAQLFTNPAKDEFATRVILKGNVSKVDVSVWAALEGIVSNAFIKSINDGFDVMGEDELLHPAQ